MLQWTLGYMCFFQFWFLWCVCPAVELLGHMGVLFQVLKETSTLFSIVAVLVCIPTNSIKRFPFSTPSPAFIVCRLFDSSHSDPYKMVPHCGFDLHFSSNEWFWTYFHILIFVSYLYVFFGEMSIQFFGPLFDWVICFSGIELDELLLCFKD